MGQPFLKQLYIEVKIYSSVPRHVCNNGILIQYVHSLVNSTTEAHNDMIGKTVVDFIGHIIFSFTRSVAEHYYFDEAELDLELFGYNPLDDTGKEWYCQPVDELIYQEYSERDGTTFDYLPSSRIQARFLNACSTEEPKKQRTQEAIEL